MTSHRATRSSIITDTAKAQNTDFLASDFQLRWPDSVMHVAIVVQSAVKVRVVPNSGSGFYLNGGTAMVADSLYEESVTVDSTRTFNLQTDDGSGCTISYLVVQEVNA